MKVISTKLFEKQYKKVPGYVKEKVVELYLEVEKCKDWSEVQGIKEMKGHENLYRIRIVDFRLGVEIIGQTFKLVTIMHRREIYRYFP